jgi:hypothetical protein
MEHPKYLTATQIVYTAMLTTSFCVAILFSCASQTERGEATTELALSETSERALPAYTQILHRIRSEDTLSVKPFSHRTRRHDSPAAEQTCSPCLQ